jgi:DNA (cytosine-5)-methyltransferase 1
MNGLDLDVNPCPTIGYVGISALSKSNYWLEDDGRERERKKTDKPAYRILSIPEIAAIPHNGFSVASTFSGGGGSCVGYKLAGFKVRWANEFVPIAQESYRANFPDTILDGRDIKHVQPEEILEAIRMKAGELDLFDGSPPCQAFSTAGKREKGWGKGKRYEHGAVQCNETLFTEYIRLLRGLQPKVFVAENVSGLVKGTAKGYFLEILCDLKASGYQVECKLLDAQWLGVPQTRQRVIFVGVRNDLGLKPAFPKPLKYRYSVRDACPWIGKAVHDTGGTFSTGEITDRPCPAITNGSIGSNGYHFKVEAEADMSGYAVGDEWGNLQPGQKSGRYLNLIKAHPDKPSPTVTTMGANHVASVCHATERRKFSIAELRRICSFPDDFILKGSYAQQWERLGNSVPPMMMFYIASAIRDGVLNKLEATGQSFDEVGCERCVA